MIVNITPREEFLIANFVDVKRFTLAITEEVKEVLKPILSNEHPKMIFDLQNIEFIDSSAIGCVISLVKTAKSSGAGFKLCNLSKDVESVFELLHLGMILDIEKDVDTCIRKFRENKK